jgi:hypothetical protein
VATRAGLDVSEKRIIPGDGGNRFPPVHPAPGNCTDSSPVKAAEKGCKIPRTCQLVLQVEVRLDYEPDNAAQTAASPSLLTHEHRQILHRR